jgi:hypothetical protein
MASMLFAHQGGWDEILFAMIPLVVVALLLVLANKRANAARRRSEHIAGEAAGAPDTADRPAAP